MRRILLGVASIVFLVIALSTKQVRANEKLPPFVILGQCSMSFQVCFNQCRMHYSEGTPNWEQNRLACGNSCGNKRKYCELQAWKSFGVPIESKQTPANENQKSMAVPIVQPVRDQSLQKIESVSRPRSATIEWSPPAATKTLKHKSQRPVIEQQRQQAKVPPKVYNNNHQVSTSPEYKSLRLKTGVNWSGFYAGGHAGYGFVDSDWTFKNIGAGQWTSRAGGEASIESKRFLGGIQGGYNKQQGQWVYGVDLALSVGDLNGSIRSPFFPANDSFKSSADILLLAQAKLGWAQDDWLIYGQAGYAGINHKIELTAGVTGFNNDSDTVWHNGFTFGAGGAYRLGEWSINLDYNYIELSQSDYALTKNGSPADLIDITLIGHITKLTANYHF